MRGPFTLAIEQFAAKAKERADQVVRQVSLEVATRVIARSPVDTGRFRANWRIAVGGPATGQLEAFDKSDEGQDTANRLAGELPRGVAGQRVYLTNNLPYAWALETGHSKQAPIGMVAITVLEFNAIVDNVAQGLDSLGVLGASS